MNAERHPTASLYVGDLHVNTTEEMLYEKFSAAGRVLSIHVCRDAHTSRSLGYAYVNFQQVYQAELALDTMNFDLINDRPMRIMWSQRDSSLRRSGVGNLFLKNLDKTIDNKTMYDTFSEFGNILSCKIEQDENGVSKGFGFIHFETEEAANTTIEKVNGMLLREKQVYVSKFIPREERENVIFTNVYVKNFGEDWDDIKLKETFEQFGKITSHRILTEDDGKSKGFGFVVFETNEAAKAAINALNGTRLSNGNFLYVGRAQKKAERQQKLKRKFDEWNRKNQNRFKGRNLYVQNLDYTINEQILRTLFFKFGRLTSVKIMMDEQGRSKGFGFVCFKSAANASSAIAEMNRQILGSKQLYITYSHNRKKFKQQH